jgi:predicted metalloprotease with PDZ domain
MSRFRPLLFVLVLAAAALRAQPDLLYRFSPTPEGDRLTLDVYVDFAPRTADSTMLDLPDDYGGQEQFEGIFDLHALTAGAALSPTSDRTKVWLRHNGMSRVAFCYRVRELRTGVVELGDHYQAVVRPGLIHALGNSILIVPNVPDSLDIEVAWTDTPSDWSFASSFGLGAGPLQTRLTMPWFRHSIWMGGQVRMRETVVHDRTVAVATHGSWSFDEGELLRLVRTIIQTERDFFDDHDFPFFLVTALGIGGDNDQGGTGRVNSFGLFLSDDRTIDLRLKRLLAHEIFHAWNGDRTEREEPEALVYWFTEGFADYYARRFLLQAGLITPQEYLDDINANLKEYFSSSMLTLKNQALVNGTSGGRELQRMPYRRGDILAHQLAVMAAKNGRSLDTVVKAYLLKALRRPATISNAALLDVLQPLLALEDRPFLQGWIDGSSSLDPARPLFTQGALLSLSERRRYYLFGEPFIIPSYQRSNKVRPDPLRP